MHAWRIVAAVGLVLALSGSAWAVTVPSFAGTGDVLNGFMAGHFYTRDREQSTAYLGADGAYSAVNPTAAFTGPGSLTEIHPAGAFMTRSGTGGGLEDVWGIFALRVLDAGAMFSPGTPFADIFRKLPVDVSYEWADMTNAMTGDTALVGVFYDGWTNSVVLGGGGTTLETRSTGIKFELWAVDKAAVNLEGGSQGPHFDANWRTAANRYTTWVTGGGTLLLSGTSTFNRFVGTQLSSDPNALAFDGSSVTYFDVPTGGPGLWNKLIGPGNYYTDPNGGIADIKLTYDIDPGLNGWAVNSHDDGGFTFAVPEPLTVLGVLVSVGSLGRYIRRRF